MAPKNQPPPAPQLFYQQRSCGRHGAAFDRRDALLGYPHVRGDLGLGHSCFLPHFGQVLGPDLERALLPGFLHGRAVVGMDELIHELIAAVSEELAVIADFGDSWRRVA